MGEGVLSLGFFCTNFNALGVNVWDQYQKNEMLYVDWKK